MKVTKPESSSADESASGSDGPAMTGSDRSTTAVLKRRHAMPFGAELTATGARFRLWAPAATRVDVDLVGRRERHAMSRRDRGWFEATIDGVRAGDRYALRIDDRVNVPDPASRANPDGVHAPSAIVDPTAYEWHDRGWRGRPWHDAVVYEIHVGAFTADGTFGAAVERLDHLADLGVTAIELMPVAAFAGKRNWGYDGVLPFAPAACYGTPGDMKRLVDAAHARGLIVLLDVVYNHFGPDGNYLSEYAPSFFDANKRTPWGAAIDFTCRDVRDFFVHNALYWIDEFHVDGLRLDAVHAIADAARADIVGEIATAVRAAAGPDRHVHVVLENDRNEARYLERDDAGRARVATAQWNDDVHHALHVIATGERDGYYGEFAARPLDLLGRALAEGFAWQGESSPWRDGAKRGEPSAHLPPTAFVDFTQTHDQIGNRAHGERLSTLAEPGGALRAAIACTLLSPAVPMLFMGEEFAASTPFLFFCDFEGELARAVTRGRRDEFGRFERFRDRDARASIPDPNDEATFVASKLDWNETCAARGREWLAFYRRLLDIRHAQIVPRLSETMRGGTFDAADGRALHVRWTLADGSALHLVANLSRRGVTAPPIDGDVLYATDGTSGSREWPPFAVVCSIEKPS
jgi:malto-oligosyltrehalose trehalohydrolase